MISTSDFKTGLTLELDNAVWSIVEFQHVKPGKGAAFVRTKLRNMRTGGVVERTFRAGEKMPRAVLDKREMEYMYPSGDEYQFMDKESFEQTHILKNQLGDAVKWLKEGMTINVLYFQGQIIGIDIPNFVELQIIETAPGVKGDTASGGSKPAIVETGATVNVPFFVNQDDVIRIDTRSGEYLDRV
ncbi:MAG TPA: elongation factor P [Cyanobacteria bacterium UBA8530]|nr:elongation factor P [Cyanobacteria bacterium UBA8530]